MAFVSRAQFVLTVFGCVVGAVAIARQEQAAYTRGGAPHTTSAASAPARDAERPRRAATPSQPLDVNRASEEDLATLPGIGPRLAERIVAHRAAHGPFRSAADIDAVPGVGTKLLAKLLPHLRVASP